MRQYIHPAVSSWALALVLATGIARDAFGAVVLTSRSSQIEIVGSANGSNASIPDSGGEAYGNGYGPPAPVSSASLSAPFAALLSRSAMAKYGGYLANSSAGQTSSTTFDALLGSPNLVGASGAGSALAGATNPANTFPISGAGGAWGNSFFDVFFDVTDAAVPYKLAGTMNAEGGNPGTLAEVGLFTTDGEGVITGIISSRSMVGTAGSSPPWEFEDIGFLSPGSYNLHMRAFAGEGGRAGVAASDSSYNVTLTVPEPSTFVLLGAGAAGLLACAWRCKRTR